MDPSLASVAVGRPVRGEFTYRIPEGMQERLKPGQRILVQFGRGKSLGFYLGRAERPPAANVVLKPILEILDEEPAVAPDVLALLRFAAEHYRYPLGEAIRSAMPPGLTQAEAVAAPAPIARFSRRVA